MPSPVSSPVSSLGSQSARKATPRRSPRPRKVTASGPQWPSSDSSDDDDDDEEVRRLEAALAAAKAKKKRRRGSGYDTLIADVLTKVIDFLPLDDAAAAKQLSSTTASAARQALTRGRWRPFKTFCQDGDGRGCEVITLQSYTDQDRALFREVWTLEPGVVINELTLWPPMPSTGQNVDEIEGAMRYLALVEPEVTSGFGRIAAAFAASGGLAARGIICQWSGRVDGDLHAGLEQGNIDLGLGAWATPTDGAAFILRLVLSFGFGSYDAFMDCVALWQDDSAADIFMDAYEEITEELWEIEEREAHFRAEYMGIPLYDADGIPLYDAESEDDISDSEVDWNLVLGEESSDSEEEED